MSKTAQTVFFAVALTLSLGGTGAADQALQEWLHIDADVRLGGASAVCGFEVRAHLVGDAHYIVFYDQAGQIVSEVDTFPTFTRTIYAPSTGKSYTTVSPAVLYTWYTNGAAIGSSATAMLTGLFERTPSDIDGGRFVYDAVVVGYDAGGVPLIRFVAEISSVGPDFDSTIAAARCDAVR